MRNVTIILPFLTDNGPRERAFNWIKKFYEISFPEYEICVGTTSSPFNKAEAINNAVRNSSGNILALIDSDIICDPRVIKNSIDLLNIHPWVIPYRQVQDLTKESSIGLLNSDPAWPLSVKLITNKRKTGRVLPVGGINILKKECFNEVNGFDERFKGWGGEDDAFAASVNTLCGPYIRTNNNIYHIWHPRLKSTINKYYKSNLKLALRYSKAQKDVKKMRQLIEERKHNFEV